MWSRWPTQPRLWHRAGSTTVTAAGLLVGLASLFGCAALAPSKETNEALAIPSAWSTVDAAGGGSAALSEASLAAWWRRFDDPQLEALVEAALRSNPNIQGAQAALRQAQALRAVAAAALWPTLDVTTSAQRGVVGGRSTGNDFQVGTGANWAVDVFGAGRAAVNAADATVGASAATLGDVQVQIAAEVALDYIVLRTAQARTAIALDNLTSQQETLQITQWRQQAGLVTSLETLQARAAVEQVRAQLPALRVSSVQTQHALAVLIGRPPASVFESTAAPDAASPAPATSTMAIVAVALAVAVPQARDGVTLRVPAQTLRQRADVRAAEFQVSAALAQVDQAQARRWPSFAIGGSLGLSAATVGALTGGTAVLGSLLASVSWPIFTAGRLGAQVQVQEAALAQAQQTYRAAVLRALLQVEDALVALNENRLRLISLRLAADAATNAAVLARQRYGSGLIDFQTVLDTQRTQLATQDGVASASADVSREQVRLFTALGGGWSQASAETAP